MNKITTASLLIEASKISSAAVLILASSPILAQNSARAPADTGISPKSDETTSLEDIVVTAQKREERLQDVPISITAFSGKALEANRIQNVRDLSAITPNLIVIPQTGGSAAPVYSMRGIVGTGSLPGQDKGISLYLDGVYLGANAGSIFDIADIERVEVLKGPQGTLFGRNATGGGISIVTHNPSGIFSAKQDLTYGNYRQFRTKTRADLPSVEVPVLGTISTAFTFLHSQRNGDIRNLGAGTRWDYTTATNGKFGVLTSPARLGDDNTDSLSAALRIQPRSSLDIIYKFDYTDRDYTDNGIGIAAAATNPLVGATLASAAIALQPAANAALLTPVSTKRPKAVNNGYTTPGASKNQGHNLTVDYVASDVISLKNIYSYRKASLHGTSDASGTGGLVATPALLAALGIANSPAVLVNAPFVLFGIRSGYKQRQWSNETQINIQLDRFKATAGYYIYDEKIISGGLPNLPSTLSFTPVPFGILTGNGIKQSRIFGHSEAAYAQAEYEIVDDLTLVGGLRQTWDHKNGVDNSRLNAPLVYDLKKNKLTWLAGVNYKPNTDTLLYAKASTGFISGGVYNGLSYSPETAISYEAGVKTDLLDRKLRTNLSVFHATYEGLQFLANTATGLAVKNAGKARAYGAEFEGTLIPANGVTLGASLGYMHFKYISLLPAIGTVGNYRPDNRPKMTSSLSAQYETPEMSWGGKLLIRADGQYKSKTFGVAAPQNAVAATATTFKGYWLLNGRLAATDISVGGMKAQIALWGRNLTNNKSFVNTPDLQFIYAGVYERARTYGLDVSFGF